MFFLLEVSKNCQSMERLGNFEVAKFLIPMGESGFSVATRSFQIKEANPQKKKSDQA